MPLILRSKSFFQRYGKWFLPLLGIVLLLTILLERVDWGRKAQKGVQRERGLEAKKVPPKVASRKQALPKAIPKDAVQAFVLKESIRVGQTVDDPQAEQERLLNFSKKLTAKDFLSLEEISLGEKYSNDARFLSTYILSLVAEERALPTLLNIAQALVQKSPLDGRLFDEEIMIRAQALEGIARIRPKFRAVAHLKEYLKTQENLVLINHVRRLLEKL